jgi:hypothetical protein
VHKGLKKFETHKLGTPLRIGSFFIEHKEFRNVELAELNGLEDGGEECDEMFD